jgi:hypothetical protein
MSDITAAVLEKLQPQIAEQISQQNQFYNVQKQFIEGSQLQTTHTVTGWDESTTDGGWTSITVDGTQVQHDQYTYAPDNTITIYPHDAAGGQVGTPWIADPEPEGPSDDQLDAMHHQLEQLMIEGLKPKKAAPAEIPAPDPTPKRLIRLPRAS